MPKKAGIWRQEWGRCDRCGFLHPLGMLSRQMGLMLCHCHDCYDNPLIWRRPYDIGMILDSEQEMNNNMSEYYYDDPTDLTFGG